jgi:DNA-binding beta-propeller fold protein YncE
MACLLPRPAAAHPGSGIVVDRLGQIYFTDTGGGVWKIDVHGKLTSVTPDLRLHWMTIDVDDRFKNVRFPSGPGWEIDALGSKPTLILASDFPIAMGQNGRLYYPTQGRAAGVQILELMPTGRNSVLATLPDAATGGPLGWVNGLTVAPDGSVYYTENNTIRRVTASGQVSTAATNISLTGCALIPGTGVGDGAFLRGLEVDTRGAMYVAASGCGAVLKITPDGRVTKLVQLTSPWTPTGIALFGGDVYVLEYSMTADENRRAWVPRIRKITPDGKSAIIAEVHR